MKNAHFGNQFFIGLVLLFAVLVAFIFLPELDAIVLGVSLAVLFHPWYAYLQKTFGSHNWLAAAIIVLLSIALIFAPLIFFGFKIFIEAQGLYKYISSGGAVPIIEYVRTWVYSFAPSFSFDINAYAQQALGVVVNNIGSIFSRALSAIVTLFLSFFAFYYFLKDGSALVSKIITWSPLPLARTKNIVEKSYEVVSSVVRGSILVGVIYGFFVGLGFFIFGVQSAILWGAITVVASFIPGIGVLLIVVPGIISLALSGNTIGAIGLTIWALILSAFVENIARPRLVGRGMNIHPLLMLFAVLGGLSFFGPIGILLGPIVLGLFLVLLQSHSPSSGLAN